MKYTNWHFFLLVIPLVLGISACSKDKTDDPPPEVSMMVDGKPWESSPDGPYSDVGASLDLNLPGAMRIDAYAENGSCISLYLAVEGGIKEDEVYTTGDVNFQAVYKLDCESDVFFSNQASGVGEITFSSYSTGEAVGTFSFRGEQFGSSGVITVEQGQFDLVVE